MLFLKKKEKRMAFLLFMAFSRLSFVSSHEECHFGDSDLPLIIIIKNMDRKLQNEERSYHSTQFQVPPANEKFEHIFVVDLQYYTWIDSNSKAKFGSGLLAFSVHTSQQHV